MNPDRTTPSPERHVPECRRDVEQTRRHNTAVCVFVLNEGEKIRTQLRRMRGVTDVADIVVADGGSTDGALDKALLRETGVHALLVKTGPGGLSAQMRMAFDFCLEQGFDGVVTMDGNNKDDPESVPGFVNLLNKGYDHIQGSRFLPGGGHEHTPRIRWAAIRWFHAPLISRAAGFRYTDTTNGFRAYSRRLLTDPRTQPFREVFSAYELHYYLAIRAPRLGFRVIETPVTRRYPPAGPLPSKISPFRGNMRVLCTLIKAVTGRYDP